MKPSVLIQGGQIVTMNHRREVLVGDLRMRAGRIESIAPQLKPEAGEELVDARHTFVIPGLVQAHTHLCQTLFRGLADDLELLDWLQKRIWPMENAHDKASLQASARLGLMEMQLLGTTSVLDMGTVRRHEVVFAEAQKSGVRYWGGNCLMDLKPMSGPLYQPTEEALAQCERLIEQWHKKTPLIQYAVSPRFAVSCTDRILRAAVRLQERHGLLLHTHASENKGEVALIRQRTGLNNVEYLSKLKLLTNRTVIAHGIHLTNREVKLMAQAQAGLVHCPNSNLKLASGLAPITRYLRAGVKVALGCDGAPCNNNMDPFLEMKLAALLQKPLFGPTALPASEAFALATVGGARVLNAEGEIGALAPGLRADVVVVRRDHPTVATVDDPYSALVYSCSGRDVRDVWIDGKAIVRASQHLIYNRTAVIEDARQELRRLISRCGF